jgi:catechol 2,3-dioxygenase-like lactoylglutathione lyase family enzyme
MKVIRLNHAVLFVTDIERAVDFYTDVFGFEVIAREPRGQCRLPAGVGVGQSP